MVAAGQRKAGWSGQVRGRGEQGGGEYRRGWLAGEEQHNWLWLLAAACCQTDAPTRGRAHLGERPVLAPDRVARAPEATMWVEGSYLRACSYSSGTLHGEEGQGEEGGWVGGH